MRYSFLICKPKIDHDVTWVLRKYLVEGEHSLQKQELFLPFDVERMREILRKSSGEGTRKRPIFKFHQVCGPNGRDNWLPLFEVTTEYRKAQEVADVLSKCVDNDELALYDGEMDCCHDITSRERAQFVKTRLAYQRYTMAIRGKFYSEPKKYAKLLIYKLGECFSGFDHFKWWIRSTIDTVISFKRGRFENGVVDFYDVLRQRAKGYGERVYCEKGCFIVENKKEMYQLRFVMEGPWIKFPMYMGWIENGTVQLEILHRMGAIQASSQMEKMSYEDREYIRSRLYLEEEFKLRGEWRNPADRFVESFRMSQWLKKKNLDIVFGRNPDETETLFQFSTNRRLGNGWDAWKTSSVLAMEDYEEAAPLFAVIEDTIPYFQRYLYDIEFHVRREEAERIIERLKVIRLQIIKNPSDPSLGGIIKCLLNSSFAWKPLDDEPDLYPRPLEQKRKSLFRHRFEIVALYDFFGWWLYEQPFSPSNSYGFYVIGP